MKFGGGFWNCFPLFFYAIRKRIRAGRLQPFGLSATNMAGMPALSEARQR
jgi:hypothetical protein